MSELSTLTATAQWLSDHTFAVTLCFALFAFLVESAFRPGTGITASPQSARHQWKSTWLTNVALLVCAMAVSWVLGLWVSPWFSEALSGRTGLLVWLGFDHGRSFAPVIIGIFLLDFVAYLLHRVMHSVPLLWRLHQVHHSDTAMNASTHFRQHPLSFIVTIALQLPILWLLGIPGISWVLYALLAAAVELWHHSAMSLPPGLDRSLRWFVVTPTFHRTHHSRERKFHDANYSAVFPVWDRLFGTVAAAPADAPLGLRRWQPTGAAGVVAVDACLAMPFRPLVLASAQTPVRAGNKLALRRGEIRRTNNRGKT